MHYLTYASLAMTLLGPALAHGAAISEFRQPNAYAIVIGISQYREEIIPRVGYAVRDAKDIASLLESHAGIPKANIKLLLDSKATYSDLRNHFGDWLRMRTKPDSTIYIYFSGHGTPNLHTGGAYLVPWDGHPDFPSGLFALNELYDTLNKLPAKNIVVFLDSCFSGSPGRSVLAKGMRPMVISVENPVLAGGKVIVLAAATGSQISSDYDKAKHGLFTYYLLLGLKGVATTDKDERVSLRELYRYVRKEVSETAVEKLNREQTPILLPGEEMLRQRADLILTRKAVPPDDVLIDTSESPPTIPAKLPNYKPPRRLPPEINGKDGAAMVLIPSGEFLYGDKQKRLLLGAFYLDKFEVTTKLYRQFILETGQKEPYRWSEVSFLSDGGRPVIGVTWQDANIYCSYYGKRLPTEQEWEKAARGQDGRKYPWGNEEPTGHLASYDLEGKRAWKDYSTLAPVGSYEKGKSPHGVYDLAGNVAEWTSSKYEEAPWEGYPARPTLPKGFEPINMVIRGGSWDAIPMYLSSTHRLKWPQLAATHAIGFRCAQDVVR